MTTMRKTLLLAGSLLPALSVGCTPNDSTGPTPTASATTSAAAPASTSRPSASSSAPPPLSPGELSDCEAKLTTVLTAALPSTSQPKPPPAGATRITWACYAWEKFFYLMSGTRATVTDGAGREIATTPAKETGKSALFNKGENPLLFEGLYHRTEAYPYYVGARPKEPYDKPPIYAFRPSQAGDGAGGKSPPPDAKSFTFEHQNYVNLDENTQITQNQIFFRDSNAPFFPLLFMAKVNHTATQYARSKDYVPSQTKSWMFPDGTLEIKSAWRRVKDIAKSNPESYHQAKATYYTGTFTGTDIKPNPVTEMFALIAIHIIFRDGAGKPFTFTTFEHVDATTRDATGAITDPQYQLDYAKLSYDTPPGAILDGPPGSRPRKTAASSEPTVPAPAMALGAFTSWPQASPPPSMPNVVTSYTLPAPGDTKNGTVVQPKTITNEIVMLNEHVRNLILKLSEGSSVWANYRLKGIQVPPTQAPKETDPDHFLANIVVESTQPGVQLFSGGVTDPTADNNQTLFNFREVKNISVGVTENNPVPSPTILMGGCQGCHGRAQGLGQDFSFLPSGAMGVGLSLDIEPSDETTESNKAALLKGELERKRKQLGY